MKYGQEFFDEGLYRVGTRLSRREFQNKTGANSKTTLYAPFMQSRMHVSYAISPGHDPQRNIKSRAQNAPGSCFLTPV